MKPQIILDLNNIMETLLFLSNWIIVNSNGDWEHENNIRLFSMSDPSWRLEIDTNGTVLANIVFKREVENIDEGWAKYYSEGQKLIGECSIHNLDKLINEIYKKCIFENPNNSLYIYEAYFKILLFELEVFYPVKIITQDFINVSISEIKEVSNLEISAKSREELEKIHDYIEKNRIDFKTYFPNISNSYKFKQVKLLNGNFPEIIL